MKIKNKIFSITLTYYDTDRIYIVLAPTEREAKKLVMEVDEINQYSEEDLWGDKKYFSCKEIDLSDRSQVISDTEVYMKIC